MTILEPEPQPSYRLTLSISDDLDRVREIAKAAQTEFDASFSAGHPDHGTVDVWIDSTSGLSVGAATSKLANFIAHYSS